MTEDTPIRHRKRGVPIRKDDTDTENDKKRPRATQNIDTFEIISSVLDAQQARRRNKVELAIQLLETNYQERLSTSHFIDAVSILETESKASVFITLKSSVIRDYWLCKNADVELL